MSFQTASAILRGQWLLDKQWSAAHLPMVANLVQGKAFEFGNKKSVNEKVTTAHAGSGTYIQRVSPYTRTEMLPQGSIVLVNISGPILKEGDICTYGSVDYTNLMNRLAAAGNVSGVIISIDSPGGQADGTAMLADSITELGTKKPVIAIIEDGMAASAAMWIASAANEIYATQPTDQFGSIGVYTTIADWNGYFESQGLKVKDIYAPQSTDKNKGYYEALAGNDELIKEDLKVLAAQFITTISKNRTGKIKEDSWKTGKLFYAADAKKIGLIDGTKSFSQVVDRINTLIKQRTNSSNNMAFEKTLVAAGSESFEVTDGGFLLQEDQLNNIETALANAETVATQLNTAQDTVQTLTQTNTDLQEQVGNQATRITELEADLERLGSQSSGTGSTTVTKVEAGAAGEAVPSYLDEKNPANQFADRYMRKKKEEA